MPSPRVVDADESGPSYDGCGGVVQNALRFSGKLGVVASEEEDHPVLVEEAYNSK